MNMGIIYDPSDNQYLLNISVKGTIPFSGIFPLIWICFGFVSLSFKPGSKMLIPAEIQPVRPGAVRQYSTVQVTKKQQNKQIE